MPKVYSIYKGEAGVCVPVNRDLLLYCSSTYYEHLTHLFHFFLHSFHVAFCAWFHVSGLGMGEWGNGASIVAKSRTHSSPSLWARRRICCISTEHYIEGGREGGREGVKEGGRGGREGGGREGGMEGERVHVSVSVKPMSCVCVREMEGRGMREGRREEGKEGRRKGGRGREGGKEGGREEGK